MLLIFTWRQQAAVKGGRTAILLEYNTQTSSAQPHCCLACLACLEKGDKKSLAKSCQVCHAKPCVGSQPYCLEALDPCGASHAWSLISYIHPLPLCYHHSSSRFVERVCDSWPLNGLFEITNTQVIYPIVSELWEIDEHGSDSACSLQLKKRETTRRP
jgi:hypothetical protein